MRTFFTFLFALAVSAITAQPKLTIDSATHDFGTFKEGPIVTCTFTVKNTGNTPLVIIGLSRPCGCTNPTFSQEPIAPGKTGTITVAYNSDGHAGIFTKTLQIQSNDPEKFHQITIKGYAVPKYIDDSRPKAPRPEGESAE